MPYGVVTSGNDHTPFASGDYSKDQFIVLRFLGLLVTSYTFCDVLTGWEVAIEDNASGIDPWLIHDCFVACFWAAFTRKLLSFLFIFADAVLHEDVLDSHSAELDDLIISEVAVIVGVAVS